VSESERLALIAEQLTKLERSIARLATGPLTEAHHSAPIRKIRTLLELPQVPA